MAKVRGFKKRLEPFAATKARGRQNAATRKLLNRIHELETELAAVQRREAHAHARAEDAERRIRSNVLTEDQLNSLRRIVHVPLTKLVDLDLQAPALVIAKWLIEIEKARKP